MSLPKAIVAIGKIFDADRRNPIARETAAKHIGYTGKSGASDKAIAALAHYGLTDKVGKGEVRVSQLAMDILHPAPNDPGSKDRAILQAGLAPQLFKDLRARFPDHVSEDSLRSYLLREGFNDTALAPAMNAYLETLRFLEQSKVFESAGKGAESDQESSSQGADGDREEGGGTAYGGAKVGDLIQWEINGVLQMEEPMRVRLVTEDGWVAVEGSETGIPMDQVIVEERPPEKPAQRTFKIEDRGAGTNAELTSLAGESEWMRNLVGKSTKVRLLVSGGDMGAKEIGKLIKLLTAQQAVLADDDEDEDGGDS
jgi:hypothetical protein